MSRHEVHEIAQLFPLMPPDEVGRLEASIREHGLLEPILLFEGRIIDGRHRYRACLEVGVAPRFEVFEGDYEAAVARTLALNFHRRHLTTVQRAALGVGIKAFEAGRLERLQAAAAQVAADAEAENAAAQVAADAEAEDAAAPDAASPADDAEAARAAAAAPNAAAAPPDPGPLDAAPPDPEAVASEQLGVSARAIRDAERIKRDAPDVFERMLTATAGSMIDARRVARFAPEVREKIHREVDEGASVKAAIRQVIPPEDSVTSPNRLKLRGALTLSDDALARWRAALARDGLTDKQAVEAAVRAWIEALPPADGG